MKFLIDMNLAPRWSDWLVGAGQEAVHWSAVAPGNATDAEIMAYAKVHDLIVLTHDLDFGAILAATQGDKPSVVQIRAEQTSPEAIGPQVLAALRQMAMELEYGALVTVEPTRLRVRLLPFRRREDGGT